MGPGAQKPFFLRGGEHIVHLPMCLSNISTVSCIHICNCNMYDNNMNAPIMIMAPP